MRDYAEQLAHNAASGPFEEDEYVTSEQLSMQDSYDRQVRGYYRRKYRNERIMKLVFWTLLAFAVGATLVCAVDLWRFFRG